MTPKVLPGPSPKPRGRGVVWKGNPALRRFLVPVADLAEDPKNARQHPDVNVAAIRASLEGFGQQKPVVAGPGGTMAAGSGTLRAAKALGWTHLAVVPTDLEGSAVVAYSIADNRTQETSSWDAPVLQVQLEDLPADLRPLTGFMNGDLESLLESLKPDGNGTGDEDQYVDDIDYDGPKESALGTVWLLGRHRLVCGDSIDAATIKTALGAAKADLLFTDPPYGVDLIDGGETPTSNGKSTIRRHGVRGPGGKGTIGGRGLVRPRAYKPVHGDDHPFDPRPFLGLAKQSILFGGNVYAHLLPPNPHWLVWDKHDRDIRQDALSFGDCELMWTNVQNRISVKVYRWNWTGLMRQGPRNEELVRRVHPTQKPVGLLADIINDYSEKADVILDPFLGSGSTLIAAERTGRTLVGIEIDPHYVDVAKNRWEKFTGKKATRQ